MLILVKLSFYETPCRYHKDIALIDKTLKLIWSRPWSDHCNALSIGQWTMSITQSASNSIEDLVEIFTTFVNVVAWICQRCYMHLHTLFVKNINFARECNVSALTLSPINLRVLVSISKTLAPRCLRLGLKNFNIEKISVSAFGHQNFGHIRSLNIELTSFGLEEVSVSCFFGIKNILAVISFFVKRFT